MMNNFEFHNLTSSTAKRKIPFHNNFGLRGCMASVVCFGSFLEFKRGDEILDSFVKNLKDNTFKSAIFKDSGLCCNVYRKDYLISKMSASLRISPLQYFNILNKYKVLQLADNSNNNHFIMVYHYDNNGIGKIYDPSYPYFLRSIPGTFRFYEKFEGKSYKEIRSYPFNPLG